jgi:hypothetical protein
VLANHPRRRSKRTRKEDFAQFKLGDPVHEATELLKLEGSFGLKRAWDDNGAANVYWRAKAVLAADGSHVLARHRFEHCRHAPDSCKTTC